MTIPADEVAPRRVVLVGVGVGSPDHLTLQAVRALGRADVVFVVDKGSTTSELTALREQILAAHGRAGVRTVALAEPPRDRDPADYRAEVARWHAARAAVWEDALRRELAPGATGAFLVWGDPALYDSTLRILDDITGAGRLRLDVEMIPGVSSVQVLTARHRIPLNTVGGSVHVTTGRRLAGEAAGHATVVVMLDGGTAWDGLDPSDWDVWWGAYLGSDHEVLEAGPLAEAGPRMAAAKRDARARHGWVMDVYLLRRRAGTSAG